MLSPSHSLRRGLFALTAVAVLQVAGCGPGTTVTVPTAYYTVTVNSTGPATGALITPNVADKNGLATGMTPVVFTYAAGTSVTFTAGASDGTRVFSGWTGCGSVLGLTCTVNVTGNATVTVAYVSPVNVTVTPSAATVGIGGSEQLNATVTGATNTGVTWTVAANAGTTNATASPGTISSTGLYQTPYPAPGSVTVTATSVADPTVSASAVLTLTTPPATTGPALTVNTTAGVVRPISPLIYGMNGYGISPALQGQVQIPFDRWGGDLTTRYNYLLDVSNSGSDYYFETSPKTNTAYPAVSDVNTEISRDRTYHAVSGVTVPLIGYTTKRQKACGFSVAKYGAQKAVDPYNTDCGNGVLANGTNITGNESADTSTAIDQTFVSGYVKELVSQFGTAANGGVGIYELDNEPEYWSSVHRDVHPAALTYDELTTKGIVYAQAIKSQDSGALVAGPEISNFEDYFYSWADLVSGWSTAPCYCYNGNPTDRKAHGNVPLLAYYLQQMKAAEASGGMRLLDYLDVHGYFAAPKTAFATAGDTALQTARLNSTRVLWDPTYTDPAYTNPAAVGSAAQPYPVQLIPLLQGLVAANYPGTKTGITEYNWGGLESVNGAIAQADVLGLFGSYGLDLGSLWGPPDPVTQKPGLLAFAMYLNYDGGGSTFGDGSLTATTADPSKLAIYAAKRSKDGAVTILVLNKTYGDLYSTIAVSSLATTAGVYTLSQANPGAIVAGTALPVANPGTGASVYGTFPAQSVTLMVLSK